MKAAWRKWHRNQTAYQRKWQALAKIWRRRYQQAANIVGGMAASNRRRIIAARIARHAHQRAGHSASAYNV